MIMKTALILLLFLLEPVIARQGMLLHVSKNNCDKVQYIILSLNCFLFFILVKSLYLIIITHQVKAKKLLKVIKS